MKNNKVIQGRWYKINKKIKKRITAKYHKIKDWVMDPKGYFLIAIDREKKILRVGYCIFKKLGNKPVNDMVSIISGKTAIEIVNTLIRYKYISTHQHAADMGIELCKAELALRYKLGYIQDKDLDVKKKLLDQFFKIFFNFKIFIEGLGGKCFALVVFLIFFLYFFAKSYTVCIFPPIFKIPFLFKIFGIILATCS